MAFYLYKKFIQNRNENESPSKPAPRRPCEHQRIVSNISDGFVELDDFRQPAREATDEELISSGGGRKQSGDCQTTNGQDGLPHSDECVVCKDKQEAMSKYRWKLMLGLCFPFMVQSLDTTLIAGAAAFIASDFSTSSTAPIPATLSLTYLRSTISIELDHLGIQPHKRNIHSNLGSIRRRFRSLCSHPIIRNLNAAGKCPLRSRSYFCFRHVLGRTSISRDRLCWSSHRHEDHPSRQSQPQRKRRQQHSFHRHSRHRVQYRASYWWISYPGFMEMVFHNQHSHRCHRTHPRTLHSQTRTSRAPEDHPCRWRCRFGTVPNVRCETLHDRFRRPVSLPVWNGTFGSCSHLGWIVLPLERCKNHSTSRRWRCTPHRFCNLGIPSPSREQALQPCSDKESHDPYQAPPSTQRGATDLHQFRHRNGHVCGLLFRQFVFHSG